MIFVRPGTPARLRRAACRRGARAGPTLPCASVSDRGFETWPTQRPRGRALLRSEIRGGADFRARLNLKPS